MMHLTGITLTGADDETDRNDLYHISNHYSQVEWGILVSEREHVSPGRSRFPSAEWIHEFTRHKPHYVKCALHLCGTTVTDFFDHYFTNTKPFDRVQLNFRWDGKDITRISKAISDFHYYHPDTKVIIQNNAANAPLITTLVNDATFDALDCINVLFDESAGAGVKPDKWLSPIDKIPCGYAGGIGPDNVLEVIDELNAVVPDRYPTWIDMETKVRYKDQFSPDLCGIVLHKALH